MKKLEVRKKYVTRKIKKQVPNVKINKNVVLIPGNPPRGFDWVFYLVKLWKKRYFPVINIYKDTLEYFYQKIDNEKNFIKNYFQLMKSQLNSHIKSVYLPFKPKMKEELREFEQNIKEQERKLKQKKLEEKKQIKREFKEKIDQIKSINLERKKIIK